MKACALAFLISVAAFAMPTLNLDPGTGPPTGSTMAGGAGFRASETIEIYFDTARDAVA